jgi:hypothetical protein
MPATSAGMAMQNRKASQARSVCAERAIMNGITEQFTKRVDLMFNEEDRTPVDLNIEERVKYDNTLYTITLNINGETIAGTSEVSIFYALRNLRLKLENMGILLLCFGASEDVYPSGMQVSMGAYSTYKMHLGKQALAKDIVNIFDSDDSVRPSTVEQQDLFHEKWIQSLSAGRRDD